MMEQGSNQGFPGDDDSGDSSGLGLSPGLIGFGVLVALLGVFVFQNTAKTPIKFIVFDTNPPLWVALLVSVLAGVILGELGGWVLRRRKNRNG